MALKLPLFDKRLSFGSFVVGEAKTAWRQVVLVLGTSGRRREKGREEGREEGREGDGVSRAGELRRADANSPAVSSPAARPPASRSFIISVDKTEAHGPGVAL